MEATPPHTDEQLMYEISVHPVSNVASLSSDEVDILKKEFIDYDRSNPELVLRELPLYLKDPKFERRFPPYVKIYNIELDILVQLFGDPDIGNVPTVLAFDCIVKSKMAELPGRKSIYEYFSIDNIDGSTRRWRISTDNQEENDWLAGRLSYIFGSRYELKQKCTW